MMAAKKVLITWALTPDAAAAAPFVLPQGASLPANMAGALIVDATISEQHTQSAIVTDHQVETGVNVTDHIRPLPERLTLEALVTNTPLDLPDGPQGDGVTGGMRAQSTVLNGKTINFTAFQFDAPFDRVKAVFGDLATAIQSGALFSVTTEVKQYKNLACVSFGARRDAGHGNALAFTMDFQALRFVDSQTAEALPKSTQTQHRGAKTGKQTPEPSQKVDDQRTAAKKVAQFAVDKVSGLLQ